MLYERKIKYFNYLENGERVRGAGFARIEMRDKLCFLTLQIQNIGIANDTKPIFLLGEGRECQLCEMQIRQGRGMMQFQLPADNLCGGIAYDKWSAVRMPLAPGREVYCEIRESGKEETAKSDWLERKTERERNLEKQGKWKENIERQTLNEGKAKEQKIEVEELKKQEILVEKKQVLKIDEEKQKKWEINEKAQQEHEVSKSLEVQNMSCERCQIQKAESFKMESSKVERTKVESSQAEEDHKKQQVVLRENKWKQLSEIYKHIAPFQDERDYLSIGPGDFVIFPEKYYKLVNNSFLLHGYYNYRHLVLTRMTVRGETRYYMGVPGNFYEREKQVALMFGFESFECREEPARDGDYGYYMMRVEL